MSKLAYQNFISKSNEEIDVNLHHIKKLKLEITDDKALNRYIIIAIFTYQLKIIDLYFQQNSMHIKIYQKKHDATLDKIRKLFTEIIRLMQDHFIMNTYPEWSQNKEYLNSLNQLTPQRMLTFISQLEHLSMMLRQEYGISSYTNVTADIYGAICRFSYNNLNIPLYLTIMKDLTHPNNLIVKNLMGFMFDMFHKGSTLYIDTFYLTSDKQMITKGLQILEVIISYYRITNNNQDLPEIIRKKQSWERQLDS